MMLIVEEKQNCEITHLTHKLSVVGLNPIKGSGYFLEQETLTSLLSTGWFQEPIRT